MNLGVEPCSRARHRMAGGAQEFALQGAGDSADRPGPDFFRLTGRELRSDGAQEWITHRRIERLGERKDDLQFGVGK